MRKKIIYITAFMLGMAFIASSNEGNKKIIRCIVCPEQCGGKAKVERNLADDDVKEISPVLHFLVTQL
jgi:hypothetical protein